MISANHQQATVMHSETYSLYSDPVQDDYQISVWLPPDYDTIATPLPVLYTLDAPEFFAFVTSVVLLHLLDDALPPMIVVGVGKKMTNLDGWWALRWRDYSPTHVKSHPLSGNASLFFELLDQTIMPFIDNTYRTNPTDRTLYGHSLSGMFSLYALQRKPTLFKRVIATSPAFVVDGHTLLPFADGLQASTSLNDNTHLYVAVSSAEPEFKPAIDTFAQAIKEQADSNLIFTYDSLGAIEHTPASTIGFIRGLRMVFSKTT